MFLAALTAGWLLCLGVGLLIGWALRGVVGDSTWRRGFDDGYWAAERDALRKLGQLHEAGVGG